MQKPDPNNSEQNAFVQDWLIAWAKRNTVYGERDWAVALHQYGNRLGWEEVERARLFDHVLELIQETYSEEDKENRRDHFDSRFPDIKVTKVIFDRDLGRIQVDGKALDGRRVWILLHTTQPVIFKRGLPFDED
jgi:hypothetical protein